MKYKLFSICINVTKCGVTFATKGGLYTPPPRAYATAPEAKADMGAEHPPIF